MNKCNHKCNHNHKHKHKHKHKCNHNHNCNKMSQMSLTQLDDFMHEFNCGQSGFNRAQGAFK